MVNFRTFWLRLTAVAGLVLLPVVAHGQAATVTGRVVDRATQQPLSDAQVIVAGTQRGARTGDDGQFRITVPPGTIQIRVIRIGYQSESRTVTVADNAATALTFSLVPTATSLGEVVITASGEAQLRRESGVSTSRIDTSQVNVANIQNFSDLLNSRAPGVVVQQAGGTSGTGSRIRIRGSNSINLSNDPLLVVDGVRVNNDPTSGSIGVGGQSASRFNDLNPDDIESVEVIKGPAASAMYGTAAANGVIQVTTKRGKVGRARWTAAAEYGTVREVGDYPNNYTTIGRNAANTARFVGCNIDFQARGLCTPNPDSLVFTNPIKNLTPFRPGWREQFGTTVSGGTDVATYYLGADLEREEGVYPINWLRKNNIRANINAQPRPNVTLEFKSGYTSSRLSLPQNDNNIFGALSGGLLGKPFDCSTAVPRNPSCGSDTTGRGYLVANHPSPRFFQFRNRQEVEHFIGSGNGSWQPAKWLNLLGTAGFDLIDRWDHETIDQGAIGIFYPEGFRFSNRAQIRTYTANSSAIGTFALGPSIRSITTAGVQWNREAFSRLDAGGFGLLPGTGSLGGLSERFEVGEPNSDIITFGSIIQQRLEWRDKLFLSAGLRADKNSNFGVNLPFVKYPSASLSWVIGEEPFFPRLAFLNTLRLRAAYGESGQRPNFRQADKYFSPVSATVDGENASAITIGGAGNADLEPERTKEFEFGFDAGLFNDRVGIEFTRYSKETSNALIARRLAPSIGATVTQLINLGLVENDGFEYMIDLKEAGPANFRVGLAVTGSVNDNKVVDLGEGITPIIFGLGGNTQRHQNGYPLGGYWGHQIVSYEDKNGDGMISRVNCTAPAGLVAAPRVVGGPECEIFLTDTAVYSGNPFGRTVLTLTPSVSLFNWVRVRALFDHRGGLTLNNSTEYFRCISPRFTCQGIQDRNAPLEDQAKAVAVQFGTRAPFFEKADFWKLRELSFTINAPQQLARALRGTAASVTIAGRNLKTWTDYKGLDPELNVSGAANFNTADFLTQPPTKYWVTRVNLTF